MQMEYRMPDDIIYASILLRAESPVLDALPLRFAKGNKRPCGGRFARTAWNSL